MKLKAKSSSSWLYYVAVTVLFFLVFIIQPKLVGGEVLCGGHGFLNSTDGICSCVEGFYGYNCQFRYCPFGKSWLSPPVEHHHRYAPNVECSNMGICDPFSGTCKCRLGYTGRACEIFDCPVGPVIQRKLVDYLIQESLGDFTIPTFAPNRSCSGHGLCRSIRDAGYYFNGLTLIRPHIYYDNWDADRIRGCICDEGWEGPDCSSQSCPKGLDPLATYDTSDVYLLECQADDGYFTIQAFGGYTEPIPHDADPGYLQYVLENIPSVGSVEISMESDSSGYPVICSSASVMTTTIKFLDHPGNAPPIRVTKNVSDTRMWPSGSTSISLSSSSSPILRMATKYVITCPTCMYCHGQIYFTYRNSVSVGINVTTSGAKTDIENAILSLDDLINEGWTSLSVTVTGTYDTVCSSLGESSLTVYIYSDYGNIPHLNMLDSSYYSFLDSSPANITFTSTKGNGTLYECSNQGICDHKTGSCQCLVHMVNETTFYRAVGSNGRGEPGTRGDCGYVITSLKSCSIYGKDACSGHGRCLNTTSACECDYGWNGINCELRNCPMGRALFDEPLTSDLAHGFQTCSGNGVCDRTTGLCTCRDGFVGSACQIKDCPRSANLAEPCSGRGWCMSISDFFENQGYVYGDSTNFNSIFDYEYFYGATKDYRIGRTSPTPPNLALTYTDTWDAQVWYECVCPVKVASGMMGNKKHSIAFPRGTIGGYYVPGDPSPGFSGYDCSQRNCPMGDTLGFRPNNQKAYNYTLVSGAFEIQRVVCTYTSSKSSSWSFRLKIFGEYSPPIYSYQGVNEVRNALQSIHSIGTVKVYFANHTLYPTDTVCSSSFSSSYGGFLVEFYTELGDLELMISDESSYVTISEYQQGTKSNLECSGSYCGICDRNRGVCQCSPGYGSSNYTNAPGYRGDCGNWRGGTSMKKTPVPTLGDLVPHIFMELDSD